VLGIGLASLPGRYRRCHTACLATLFMTRAPKRESIIARRTLTTLIASDLDAIRPACEAGSVAQTAGGMGDSFIDHFVPLYRATFEGLFRYAVAISRNRDVAEDAVQECFLRYIVARKDGQSIDNAKAWLYRVLRNLLLDLNKKAGPDSSFSLEVVRRQADPQQEPEAVYRGAELKAHLASVLTARELECMQLRIEGLRYDEIAQVLQIRPGTVGALLGRALKKAQKVFRFERIARCSKD
jgi:RNA polymerase sigma-70 factor, ECF subfamily